MEDYSTTNKYYVSPRVLFDKIEKEVKLWVSADRGGKIFE
jgi:hypothetical protein